MHQRHRRRQRDVRRTAVAVLLTLAAQVALVEQSSGLVFAADTGSPTKSTTKVSGPAEAQDEASAVLMARLQHRKIEVLSERTADSSTFALPGGQMQTQAYAGPVRTKVDGVWKNIDTSLSDTGADLTPAVAPADVAVSDGGDTHLASVSKGKQSFGLGWAAKLPAPSVKANTASYALGSGQTLSVSALAQGFSENIRLAHRPADGAVSYRIPLNLSGLKLSRAASGHLLLKDTGGKLVAEAPAPVMWDATIDRASGESAHQEQVATKVETAADGSQTLVLTPDTSFLATAAYPVTVDPTTTLAVTTDTWVQNPDYPDSQISSEELKSGTYDGGTDTARSYMKFDVSKFVGKHITAANLSLYNYYSATCSTSGPATLAKRVTSTWTSSGITWGAQPTTTTTGDASNTGHWGYDSTCAANWSNWNLQAITQAWADGSSNQGIQIASASETDSTTWRRFRSANYATSGYAPKLSVTYNSYATTSSSAVSPNYPNPYNGKTYVTSLTPTLSAKVTDADGGNAQGQYEITADPAYADNTYSYTAYGHTVASGAVSSLLIPTASAFPAGAHLRFRVRAYDGTDFGAWSAYKTFVMNTALPAAPTVSCTPYTANTWTATATGGATCTLDTTSTDGLGFEWGLDDSTVPGRVYDTTDGSGGDPLTITVKPGEDWHKLYAKTIDSGGNLSSATTTYAFGVGSGAGLLTPGDGDSAARRVSLTSTGKSTYTGVTYQYRRGETDTWHSVPLADVTKSSDGSAVSAWPVTVTGGSPAALTWNVTTSLTEDGAVDIRAAFTDGTTTAYSQPHTITVDRNAGTAPSADVGPGSVNALTGDFSLSATDTSVFGLSVERSASSRTPTAGMTADGQAAIFGPQWSAGVSDDATDTDWAYLRRTTDTSVSVVDVDSGDTGFTATSSGGWKPEPGLENLTLTSKDSTGSTTNDLTKVSVFSLKDDEGITTTFTKTNASVATWQVATVHSPTENSTATVVSEKITSGAGAFVRPTYMIAPTSAVSADQCQTAIDAATVAGHDYFTNTSTNTGCRVLRFVYASSTTATGSTLGNYTGQVQQIEQWAVTPGGSTTTATAVAQYAYDATGRLREQWDPRISPRLTTAYTYDSAGRVATLTPPGELPWTFTYGQAGNTATAGAGMLLSASRPNLTAGTQSTTDGTTATTSVVYDVPLSGTNAPNQMGTSDVANWGQSDIPTDATAVFPADSVPSSHTGTDLAASDYKQAGITYTDASGQEVDTATPGGHITATEYDRFGNTVRELTAGNRELALATSGAGKAEQVALSIDQMSSPDRAELLSTRSVYSADGLRETDEKGPLHLVTLTSALAAGSGGTDLPAGTSWPARRHTVDTYDEGRPTDGTASVADQVTTTKVGASVEGYPTDADVRTTSIQYDWVKGLPTKTITDPNGLALARTTSYDSQGRVIRTSLPKSSGSDAGATVTTYYSATGSGACNGRPEWADLVCSTGPGGSVTGGGSNPTALPTKTTEYDRWGDTTKISEVSGSTTRTTTLGYDGAGRVTQRSITSTAGATVPDMTMTYDTTDGQLATTSNGTATVTHVHDDLGREISYDDGAGNTATTAYDPEGRPVRTTDSVPSTTTYTYDTSKDPRGLQTSRTDSVAGTFAAAYDADGNLTAESLPGGYTLTVGYDETGAQLSRTYTRDSDGTVVAADDIDRSVHAETVTDTDTNGQTRARAYGYDAGGRLVQADDTATDGSCTRRGYTFDGDSNRTALAVSTSTAGSACTSSGATTTSYTYDSADRLTTSGTVYDALGRTTTQAGGSTVDYYANDLVHQQTSADGASRQTWTPDAAGRLAAWTTETNSAGTWTRTAAKNNHYGADGDVPTWIQEASGTVTRNVQGIDGELRATTGATGGTVLELTDVHGDVTVQLPLDTTQPVVASAYDEYGNPEDSTSATRYGWLGGHQRSGETVTGAILMGLRLYDPTTGRFLSTDPIAGGSANAYDYAGANPVTNTDLNGTMIVCGDGRTGSQCNGHPRNTRWTSEGRHTYTTKWDPSYFNTMPARLRAFLQTIQALFMVGVYVDGSWWRYRYHYTRYGRWHNGKWQTKKGSMDLYAEQPRIRIWVNFVGYFSKTGPWDYFEYYN